MLGFSIKKTKKYKLSYKTLDINLTPLKFSLKNDFILVN